MIFITNSLKYYIPLSPIVFKGLIVNEEIPAYAGMTVIEC